MVLKTVRHRVDEKRDQRTHFGDQERKFEPKLLSLKSWLVAILVLVVVVMVMGAIHLGLTVRGKGHVVGAHSLGLRLEENQKTSKVAAQSPPVSQKQKKTTKKKKIPKNQKNLKRSQSLKTHSKRYCQIFWIKS